MTSGAIPPFDQYQMPGSPPDSGPVTGGLDSEQVTTLIVTNDNLGALSGPVNQVMQTNIAEYNATVQPKIDVSVRAATTGNVGGVSYSDLQTAVNLLLARITNTVSGAPVPNAAPSVTFPGGSADGGENATITPGTYTTSTPSSVSWTIKLDGTIMFTTTNVNFVVPTVTGSGHVLMVVESYVFNGQTFTGKQSATYTINAPAVSVPVAATKPGPIVIANNVASAPVGTYSPAADAYTYQWLDQTGTLLGTTLTLNTSALAGVILTFVVTPSLSGNLGLPNTSLPTTVPNGVAPTYVGGIEPGFVVPTGGFAVSTRMTLDLGSALNNPQIYDIQLYRDGAIMTNAGAFATGVTSFSYVPITIDVDQLISAAVTPRNSQVGVSVATAGVLIGPQVSGNTGVISFVGLSHNGSSNTVATVAVGSPAGSQIADICVMLGTINTAVGLTFTTPSGWTLAGTAISQSTPEGQYAVAYTRILDGTETWPLTLTASGNEYKEAVIVAYRGATRVVAAASAGSSASNTSPLTVATHTVTADAAGQKLVTAIAYDILNGSAGPVAYPTQATQFNTRVNMGWSGTDSGVVSMLDQDLAASGATGSVPFVATTDSTATGWASFNVILGL